MHLVIVYRFFIIINYNIIFLIKQKSKKIKIIKHNINVNVIIEYYYKINNYIIGKKLKKYKKKIIHTYFLYLKIKQKNQFT